jgi:hypothetical protein
MGFAINFTRIVKLRPTAGAWFQAALLRGTAANTELAGRHSGNPAPETPSFQTLWGRDGYLLRQPDTTTEGTLRVLLRLSGIAASASSAVVLEVREQLMKRTRRAGEARSLQTFANKIPFATLPDRKRLILNGGNFSYLHATPP